VACRSALLPTFFPTCSTIGFFFGGSVVCIYGDSGTTELVLSAVYGDAEIRLLIIVSIWSRVDFVAAFDNGII
jgi:hypothetical protein